MKRISFIILLVSVLFVNPSYSQFLKHYGLKLAITSATQHYELLGSPLDLERRIGFNIAGYLEWLDVPSFSVITQGEYTQRGMGTSFVNTDEFGNKLSTMTLHSRLDYLSFPILFKFTYPMESVSPYIIGGPRADFLLGYQSDQGLFNRIYDDFKKTTIGGSAGIGVQVSKILPVDLHAEFRYNFDFANSYSTDLVKMSNNAYDVWIGVGF